MPPPSDPIQPMPPTRYWHLVRHLHRCGPRAVGEFLAELAAERMLRIDIEQRLERYERLDPAVLKALGADQVPPVPVHAVRT